MIDAVTLHKWKEIAKQDNACNIFVSSDIRQMLGEIDRLNYKIEQAKKWIRENKYKFEI